MVRGPKVRQEHNASRQGSAPLTPEGAGSLQSARTRADSITEVASRDCCGESGSRSWLSLRADAFRRLPARASRIDTSGRCGSVGWWTAAAGPPPGGVTRCLVEAARPGAIGHHVDVIEQTLTCRLCGGAPTSTRTRSRRAGSMSRRCAICWSTPSDRVCSIKRGRPAWGIAPRLKLALAHALDPVAACTAIGRAHAARDAASARASPPTFFTSAQAQLLASSTVLDEWRHRWSGGG